MQGVERRSAAGPGPAGGARGSRWLAAVLSAAMLAALGVGPLAAQSGVVGGVVIESRTLRPLPGAQVVAAGTQRGSLTDANGHFTISGLVGSSVELEVVMLGYGTAKVTAAVGRTDLRIPLEELAVALNELVVTGQPGGTQKRAIGNSIAQIKAADVVASAPIRTMQDLINGRAPGVVVMPGTGMVGAGSKIRIRGTSTFSLSGDPLIYVDGVRVDNSTATGMNVQSFGSAVVSRLNDFNPEEIESVEILKGPAAATLYGTEAARGVINIITKKGTPGQTRFDVSVKQGANWLLNPQGNFPINYWKDPSGNIQSLNLVQMRNDMGQPVFRTGQLQEYAANVSGGTSQLRYFVGANLGRSEGAERNNFQNSFSGRVNVEAEPNEKIKFTASSGYSKNRTGLSCEGGCGGAVWGLVYSTPANLPEYRCADRPGYGCDFWGGFQNGLPERTYTLHNEQGVDRYTGSLQAVWKPFKWLTNRATIGLDLASEQNLQYRPYITNDTLVYFLGPTTSEGFRFQARWTRLNKTYDYAGTANFQFTPKVSSATSVGAQYYVRHTESLRAQGNQFAGPGLSSIGAAATKPVADDGFVDNNTLGLYGQQTFGWQDRLFLTAALRVDNNSAFGSDVQWATYPKASLSWVLSEEPGFRSLVSPSLVSALKLRAAYGQSGQQPASFSAIRTYDPVTGPNSTPAITTGSYGNPDLGPERGEEIEVGFDAGFLDDRLGLDLTYYHTVTKDAILLRPIAPSLGYSGSRYVNAGQIMNQGLEALIKARLLEGARFGWDVNVNLSTNSGKVQQLSGTAGDSTIVYGLFNTLEHRVGYNPASWFQPKVVSANYDAATDRVTDILCDDGRGGTTPCYDESGAVAAPRLYMGRALPKFEGSVQTNFTLFRRLRLSGMIDFKTGHKRFDNTTRIRCQLYSTCPETVRPEEADPVLLAQIRSNDRLDGWDIQDASFARLREISLNYALPESYVRRLGVRGASIDVAARNLATWTKWTGLDPEAMFLEGSRPYVEQNNLPQLTSFVTTLRVNF